MCGLALDAGLGLDFGEHGAVAIDAARSLLQFALRMSGEECGECNGSGVAMFGDTTCGRGGVGGQMLVSTWCESCQGRGFDKWDLP